MDRSDAAAQRHTSVCRGLPVGGPARETVVAWPGRRSVRRLAAAGMQGASAIEGLEELASSGIRLPLEFNDSNWVFVLKMDDLHTAAGEVKPGET